MKLNSNCEVPLPYYWLGFLLSSSYVRQRASWRMLYIRRHQTFFCSLHSSCNGSFRKQVSLSIPVRPNTKNLCINALHWLKLALLCVGVGNEEWEQKTHCNYDTWSWTPQMDHMQPTYPFGSLPSISYWFWSTTRDR